MPELALKQPELDPKQIEEKIYQIRKEQLAEGVLALAYFVSTLAYLGPKVIEMVAGLNIPIDIQPVVFIAILTVIQLPALSLGVIASDGEELIGALKKKLKESVHAAEIHNVPVASPEFAQEVKIDSESHELINCRFCGTTYTFNFNPNNSKETKNCPSCGGSPS